MIPITGLNNIDPTAIFAASQKASISNIKRLEMNGEAVSLQRLEDELNDPENKQLKIKVTTKEGDIVSFTLVSGLEKQAAFLSASI
ncbi:MAG: hypothetical protein NTZ10_06910 [Candidatus Saganbacteria bacterium]|nr:hypothetical protein [Candidatus Saganbacteria bacterium]